jgi:hypothetical protein
MEIARSIARENVHLGAVAAFGPDSPSRFFDRVDVYIYDAIRKAFPGTVKIGSSR